MSDAPTAERLNALHPAWHALRHAPPAARVELLALYELGARIEETPERIREASVATMKLAWWREEIERMARGAARHPLCQRLQSELPPQRLELLRGFVAVQERALAPTPPADVDALLEQAGQQAAIERLAMLWCDGDDAIALAVGRFRYLVERLNRVGVALRLGRCPLALATPHDAAALLRLPDPDFNTAIAPTLDAIESRLAPPPRAAPALLRALHGQTRALYRAIRNNPAQCRRRKILLTPLALFWHGWKGVLLAE